MGIEYVVFWWRTVSGCRVCCVLVEDCLCVWTSSNQSIATVLGQCFDGSIMELL